MLLLMLLGIADTDLMSATTVLLCFDLKDICGTRTASRVLRMTMVTDCTKRPKLTHTHWVA